MNSTGLFPCQNIRVSVDLHASDQKEGQSAGNGITQFFHQGGQNVQFLAHRSIASMPEAGSMINQHNGGVEFGKASEDDYSHHRSPVICNEWQEYLRLIAIRDQLTEHIKSECPAEVTARNSYVEFTQAPLQHSKYGRKNGGNHVSHVKNEQLPAEAKPDVKLLCEEYEKLKILNQLREEDFFKKGIESEPPPGNQNWKKHVGEVAMQIISRIIPCISCNHKR